MEIVYVVEFMYPSGGTVILGIFTDKEKADAAVESTRKDRGYIGEFGNLDRYLVSRFVMNAHIWLGVIE